MKPVSSMSTTKLRNGFRKDSSKHTLRSSKHKAKSSDPRLDRFPLPPSALESANQTSEASQALETARLLPESRNVRRSSGSSTSSGRPHKRNIFRRTSQRYSDNNIARVCDISNRERTMAPNTYDPPPTLYPKPRTKSQENNKITGSAYKTKSKKFARSTEVRHSVQSSESSNSSLRAFKVRSLDVLSPRPKLWMTESATISDLQRYPVLDDVRGHEWRGTRELPITEEVTSPRRNRVYALADALDSRGIREALERDARRRERRLREESARAQAKLERKAEKQKLEDEEQSYGTRTVNAGEAVQAVHDVLEEAILPSETLPDPQPRNIDSLDGVPRASTPMSWVQAIPDTQEPLSRTTSSDMPIQQGKSYANSIDISKPGSVQDEYTGEPLVRTATAVRLSTCTTSSTPEPSLMRTPTLVHHSPSTSKRGSRHDNLDNFDLSQHHQGEALANAWSSFFKKATSARVRREHEKDLNETAYQTPPPEDGQDVVKNVSYMQPQSNLVLNRAQHAPTPPLDDRRLSQATSAIVPNSSRSPSKVDSMSSYAVKLPPSGSLSVSGTGESHENQTHTSKYFSGMSYYQKAASSSRSSLNEKPNVSRSMASLDSEGSWLSGRLGPRQSFSPIRNSAASLRQRYRDIEGHEDRRASVADDEYFSGVPRAEDAHSIESSDEDERVILASYTDRGSNAISGRDSVESSIIRRTSMNSPVIRSSPFEGTDGGAWREGLGRKPTITRVHASAEKTRDGLVNRYQQRQSHDFSVAGRPAHSIPQPMHGEVLGSDDIPDHMEHNPPSPTLGNNNLPFITSGRM